MYTEKSAIQILTEQLEKLEKENKYWKERYNLVDVELKEAYVTIEYLHGNKGE